MCHWPSTKHRTRPQDDDDKDSGDCAEGRDRNNLFKIQYTRVVCGGIFTRCRRHPSLQESGATSRAWEPTFPLRDAAANILLGFVAWPLLCHNTWWGENTNRRINCLPPPDLILLLSSARLPNNKPIIFPLSSFSLVRNATSGFLAE